MTCLIGTLLALAVAAGTMADELTASVDRNRIGIDETFTFKVRYSGGQVNGSPDFSGLEQEFDVLSNQKSMQHSIINGDVSAFTEWTLVLAPTHTGQSLIPPLTLEGQSTAPITVEITDAQAASATGKQDVFIETDIDKTEVYVQEQVIVTYRLFYNRSVDKLDRDDLSLANARIEELPHVEYQRTLGQTPYGVAEFRYAIFPTASGQLEIPAAMWSVRTTDQPSSRRFGFSGGNFKMYRARTNNLNIEVKPRPSGYPAGKTWIPTTELTLSESWSRSPDTFTVGEPITRTITMEAAGIRSEQLPPLVFSDSTGRFKFYPDQPRQDNAVDSDGITASRIESVAIVPTAGGTLTLPEVTVHWWDTAEDRLRTTSLPAQEVEVAGLAAPDIPPSQVSDEPVEQTSSTTASVQSPPIIWPVLTAILSASTLLFALLWWQRGRSGRAPITQTSDAQTTTQQQALQAALSQSDPWQFRKHLLLWAHLRWPHLSKVTLCDIGRQTDSPQLAKELEKLDKALYGNGAVEVDLDQIKQILRSQRPLPLRNSNGPRGLRPLYND